MGGALDPATKTILNAIYPIGSYYMGKQSSCPIQDLGVGTWTLISSNRALWTGNGSNAGTTIEAGLPNITGNAALWGSAVRYGSGALNVAYQPQNAQVSQGSANGNSIGFDASKSNEIYGKSTTVQPPAIVVNVWERTA